MFVYVIKREVDKGSWIKVQPGENSVNGDVKLVRGTGREDIAWFRQEQS